MPAAPAGGFPQTPPLRAGIITQSIDDTLVTPSAHMTSAIVGYDLGRNYTIEAGYVGRFGRDLLIRRDLAMPLNLVDPRVGHGLLHRGAERSSARRRPPGITGNSPAARMPALPAIAYWENLFPARPAAA